MAVSERNDGKQLESLIAYIEGLRLPAGWKVTPRKLMPSTAGGTAAELDIVISGTVGTMDFTWLIECRDRRKSKAPASWIEQLVTRRTRFNLSRVTAVSTSGFSRGAVELANLYGVDLREFKQLTADEFSSWPELKFMPHRTDIVLLESAALGFDSYDSVQVEKTVMEKVASLNSLSTLKSVATGTVVTIQSIFTKVIDSNPEILADLKTNGPALPVHFKVNMPANNSYTLATDIGSIPVAVIVFRGSALRTEELQPLLAAGEYLHTHDRASIARIRTYAPQSLLGINIQAEIHESPDIDGATLVLRAIDATKPNRK
nr:hypothetical protein [uncultured Pseudomonas sp.]